MSTSHDHLVLHMGPHNSVAQGPMELKVITDGEIVVSAEPEVGLLHRGLEKIAERISWTSFTPYTDRLDYLSAIHCNLAYAMAVEQLANIEVPIRASYIRIITSELNRIASHLYVMGMLADRIGGRTLLMYILRDREKINNLFEILCGSRLTYNYVRIGGVAHDVTDGFVEKTYEFFDYFKPKLKEYYDVFVNNQIFIGRLVGIGIISQEEGIQAGLSGPNLRSTGVHWDLRKHAPYSGYEKVDFEISTGHSGWGVRGDALSRYMARFQELEQSSIIIRQALDALPDSNYKINLPRDFTVPSGEAYAAIESSRGILGVYIKSSGKSCPERVKFRTPSFNILSLFPKIVSGVQISDVDTIVGSLDVMVSEVDR